MLLLLFVVLVVVCFLFVCFKVCVFWWFLIFVFCDAFSMLLLFICASTGWKHPWGGIFPLIFSGALEGKILGADRGNMLCLFCCLFLLCVFVYVVLGFSFMISHLLVAVFVCVCLFF